MNKIKEITNQIHIGNQFIKILSIGPWYLISTLITKLTSLFLMPINTSYLAPSDYGILNTLSAFGQLIPLFMSLAIDSSFARYYFQEKKISWENVQKLYSTLYWFIIIWGTFVTAVSLFITDKYFTEMLDIPFWPYIPLAIIPNLFAQIVIMGSAFLRINLEVKKKVFIDIISFVFSTAITIYMLVSLKMGIKANLFGGFVGILICFLYYTFISIKYSLLKMRFEYKMLTRSLKFSLPIIPTLAGSWINSLSDRLILSYYGRISETGLYSISVIISQVVHYFNDAITQVQSPIGMASLIENKESGKEKITEFIYFFIWTITLIYFIVTFFSKEIIVIFTNQRYHSAYKIIGILSFIYVLNGIYRPFMTIVSYHKKTWVFMAGGLTSAFTNIVLNLIFIPKYGQLAAAWTTLISSIIYSGWIIIFSQIIDPIKINIKFIIKIFAIIVTLLAIYNILDSIIDSFILLFLIKIIMIIIYFYTLYLFKELNMIKDIIGNTYLKLKNWSNIR